MTENNDNELKRELALIRLRDPFYRGLVFAKVGTWQEYGKIPSNCYEETVSNTPNQIAYHELFKKRLLSGEAITDKGLQNDANHLISISIVDAKLSDIFKLIGSEQDIDDNYKDKYVKELDNEKVIEIVESYKRMIADQEAARTLMSRTGNTRKSLEDKFGKPSKEDNE